MKLLQSEKYGEFFRFSRWRCERLRRRAGHFTEGESSLREAYHRCLWHHRLHHRCNHHFFVRSAHSLVAYDKPVSKRSFWINQKTVGADLVSHPRLWCFYAFAIVIVTSSPLMFQSFTTPSRDVTSSSQRTAVVNVFSFALTYPMTFSLPLIATLM